MFLQHGVESVGAIVREWAHRGLQDPQPGQHAAGRDRSVLLGLPTAQLHQQPLQCRRLVVVPCSNAQIEAPAPKAISSLIRSRWPLPAASPPTASRHS